VPKGSDKGLMEVWKRRKSQLGRGGNQRKNESQIAHLQQFRRENSQIRLGEQDLNTVIKSLDNTALLVLSTVPIPLGISQRRYPPPSGYKNSLGYGHPVSTIFTFYKILPLI